jgi:hypothetical protein
MLVSVSVARVCMYNNNHDTWRGKKKLGVPKGRRKHKEREVSRCKSRRGSEGRDVIVKESQRANFAKQKRLCTKK